VPLQAAGDLLLTFAGGCAILAALKPAASAARLRGQFDDDTKGRIPRLPCASGNTARALSQAPKQRQTRVAAFCCAADTLPGAGENKPMSRSHTAPDPIMYRRYQLWSVDPLSDDARPIFGTRTLEGVKRIIDTYNQRDDCIRIAEARPIDVEVADDHVYECRVHLHSGRSVVRQVMAADAYAVLRHVSRRNVACVEIWLFAEEMQSGDVPVIRAERRGRAWIIRRPNPAAPARKDGVK
jgi:hypothetical protein